LRLTIRFEPVVDVTIEIVIAVDGRTASLNLISDFFDSRSRIGGRIQT
jgi:hypothetical protein